MNDALDEKTKEKNYGRLSNEGSDKFSGSKSWSQRIGSKNQKHWIKKWERFEELYWKASRGELFHWRATAEGRLAEICSWTKFLAIFFEGLPKLFATDSLALVLAQEGLEQALDLPVVQRGFFLMPFMHSESLVIHEEALRLFDQWGWKAFEVREDAHEIFFDNLDVIHIGMPS